MQVIPLRALLAQHEGQLVLDEAQALPGAQAGLAVARVGTMAPPPDLVVRLMSALQAEGRVLLIAKTKGLFGFWGNDEALLTALCALLLEQGLVEIGAARTPDRLRAELLVWGSLRVR